MKTYERSYILATSAVAVAAGGNAEAEIQMGGKDFEQLYEMEAVITMTNAAGTTDAGAPIPRETEAKDTNNDNLPFPQQIFVRIKNEQEDFQNVEVPVSVAFARDGAFSLLSRSQRWDSKTRLVFSFRNSSGYGVKVQVIMRGVQHYRAA